MDQPIPPFLRDLVDRFNAAMVSNDVARIAECITDDWILVTSQGPVSRERMLDVIASGVLSHATMSFEPARARLYGDVAIVTGRGQNTGSFQGAPMSADEWITEVYRRTEAGWKCTLTHLTPAG